MATTTRKQAIFSGHTFFTILNDDGTEKSATFGILCAEILQYTPTFNRVDVISGCTEDYGQAIKTFNIPQVAQVDVTLKDVTAKVFAMQFMGLAADVIIPAVNDIAGTFTIPTDDWFRVDDTYQNLDTFTIAGSTPDVDYTWHEATGYVKIIAGGNLAVSALITYDATRAVNTVTQFDALTETSILVRIEWAGQDIDTKEKYSHVIGRANLVPSAPIDWQSVNPQVVALTGTSETVAISQGLTSRITIGG